MQNGWIWIFVVSVIVLLCAMYQANINLQYSYALMYYLLCIHLKIGRSILVHKNIVGQVKMFYFQSLMSDTQLLYERHHKTWNEQRVQIVVLTFYLDRFLFSCLKHSSWKNNNKRVLIHFPMEKELNIYLKESVRKTPYQYIAWEVSYDIWHFKPTSNTQELWERIHMLVAFSYDCNC